MTNKVNNPTDTANVAVRPLLKRGGFKETVPTESFT